MIGTTTDNMVMPVAPFGGYNNGMNNGFGGDWGIWFILLIIFCGWGGNGFGGGFGGNNQLSYDFPWLLNGQNSINANTNNGFRDAMINDGINSIENSITSGFGNVQTALCSGFAGVNSSITGAQNSLSQQLYTNQIADMNQRFTDALAQTNQMNNLAAGLQNCCCENRAGLSDIKYAIATENCADRQAISDGLRDIIAANTASTQRILDQMCQDKIDSKNEEIANLRQQLSMAQLASSQNLQTQTILAGQERQAGLVEQYVRPVPQPAYIVQNPNCCAGFSQGCGCGM